MSKDVVIGVDIGTTATKVAALDAAGDQLGGCRRDYPLESSLPGRAEQDPERILDTVLECIRAVARDCVTAGAAVQGVGLSAAMHGLMALDEKGAPLTRLITWADGRAVEQARRLKERSDGSSIYGRTGTPLHPMSPLAKLLWFRECDSTTFERSAHWIGMKEYLLLRLFGVLIVDHSIASATGLFDLRELDWDADLLEMVNVARDALPEPVATTHAVGGLSKEWSGRLELPDGVPFVVGASDGVLANLGVGAIDAGVAACTIGTSGAVRMCAPEPRTDAKGRIFCYALTDDLWVLGGPINNGGVALSWLRENVFLDVAGAATASGRDPYEDLVGLASEAPAGSGGLIFLPYLLGERAPHWNADARGALIGLTIRHDRTHIVRAVMEGVALQLHSVLRVLEDVTGEATEFRATGGFARSSLWRQIAADVFGSDVLFPKRHESSCFGAAVLAMFALGMIDSLGRVKDMVAIEHRHSPDAAAARVYAQLAEVFPSLYAGVEPHFGRLSDLQRRLA
ncbi:MAG: gluconokinase [Actinomycetota bacterium]